MEISSSITFGDINIMLDEKHVVEESQIDIKPIERRQLLTGIALPLTFRKTCPYRDIKDYILSKDTEKQIKYSTKWEISRNCTCVSRFNAQKRLREKTLLLDRFRKQAVVKRTLYDKKWNALYNKELTFKALFVKFHKFVKENQEKRERAERKITEEKELQDRRSLDIEIMQDDFKETNELKKMMETQIKEHKMYEDYLHAVLMASQNYKNAHDILARYDSLVDTRSSLCDKQQQGLLALENARTTLMKLIEEKVLVLVGLQNQLNNLQERYDLAYIKSLQWESTVSKIQDISGDEITKLHMVKDSIRYTFMDMCKRKHLKMDVDDDDFETMLSFIKRTLKGLRHVVNKYASVKSGKYK